VFRDKRSELSFANDIIENMDAGLESFRAIMAALLSKK